MTRSGILPALCLLPALFFAGPASAQTADCSFWTSDEGSAWSGVTLDQIQFCIASGMDVNDDVEGRHPIASAARYSDMEVFKTLLHESKDINANDVQSSAGHTMMFSLANDSDQRLELLLDAGATFTQTQLDTILASAAISSSLKSIDKLIGMGADPLARPFGQTILHFAVREEDMPADTVEHLIDIGVPVDARAIRTGILGEEGFTALMFAAGLMNHEVVKKLLDRGADVNAASNLGYTPLHAAINAEDGDYVDKRMIIRALIAARADVNATLRQGGAPIHAALSSGSDADKLVITRLLLEAGANINAQDQKLNSPLHMAVLEENSELIDLILKWNPNVNIRDADGKTPWNYAGRTVDGEDLDPELMHAYWRIYDASF